MAINWVIDPQRSENVRILSRNESKNDAVFFDMVRQTSQYREIVARINWEIWKYNTEKRKFLHLELEFWMVDCLIYDCKVAGWALEVHAPNTTAIEFTGIWSCVLQAIDMEEKGA